MSGTQMLTPQEFISALRDLMARVPAPPPLSKAERKLAHNNARMSDDELHASAGIVGASEVIATTIGFTADDVRQIMDDAYLWRPAQNELRGALRSVTDANIVRRARASIIAREAYAIGREMLRSPGFSHLEEHVATVRRLKALRRRGKPRSTPDAAEETAQEP